MKELDSCFWQGPDGYPLDWTGRKDTNWIEVDQVTNIPVDPKEVAKLAAHIGRSAATMTTNWLSREEWAKERRTPYHGRFPDTSDSLSSPSQRGCERNGSARLVGVTRHAFRISGSREMVRSIGLEADERLASSGSLAFLKEDINPNRWFWFSSWVKQVDFDMLNY
jgi:hypothetical protein